ncbi:thiamine phosphate synthase [Corynebacterium anserum]|uniref:Thiamine-phosphate synthase n=1 Tax=Corynebacterium anserum TaxID=2684406 RepID=A0A7G7YM94_9CORY|nr:thiamine phosphate synthase [Corynebacterium anserum]QNH95614.1 thiamine phosphate synthase [Corynebacterium anserum]
MSTQQTSHNATPDFGVYLVTDPYLGGGPENVPDIVAAAIEGGVRTVQLRDKDATESQITERAEELLQRIGGRIPLFIDDRLEVAQKLGIHLHIGQTDVPYVYARRVLPDHLMIGLSASTKDQIDAVAEQCAEAGVALPDLIGIGPVFPTTTKEDAADACGVEHLGEVARYAAEKGMPSVAIGGINAACVPALLGTGIHGVCVVSDIMAADDPKAAADKLSAAFNATTLDPLTLNHVAIDHSTLNHTDTSQGSH